MYEVLRLSVRKSGGCCNERLGLRCANRGWSRFTPFTGCFLFLPTLSGSLGAMVQQLIAINTGDAQRRVVHWRMKWKDTGS